MMKGRKYQSFHRARSPARRLPAFSFPPEADFVFDVGDRAFEAGPSSMWGRPWCGCSR